MGGKSKQSQRTKNNVRPSSSSRSAELLSGGMSIEGGLKSIAGGKPLPPLFPTLAAANLEQGLNPEFQMCIKKLNKKDPITRAKALHELRELVNKGDVEDVVAALPSWAHFYKILTADTDRKVREMAQVCHGAMVRVCGRRTAPQLKALLPAWLQAQYDDHAPAQAQAHLSLTSTFPDSKLPEVISFCKAEVMSHLLDNLIGNTEAIVNKRIENLEERQLVMNRITTSSLQGLQYFCVHLPAAHDAWLWDQLRPLLQAPAYWNLAHTTPQVRAAWFGATGRLVERYRDLFGEQYGARCLRVLLQAARDTSAPLWTCLLQLMHNVQNWHTYLDKKELLVKRILDVLENGGWGDARHLSNMLLPLLAYLPQDILTKDFYESFFSAMFVGLEKKNILNSKSERQAWITSLAECLRYLSIQQNEFVLEILSGVQRAWLACVLDLQHDGQTRTSLIRCSATNMASLLKYWLKQSKEENSEKYDQLIRNFWQNVGSTVLAQIDKSSTDHNEIGKLIEGHILLLQTLKTTFSQEVKKKHSIKFDGDAPTVTEKSAVVTQQCDASVVERYNHNLEDVVHKICAHYLESAEKKQMSSGIVTPVFTLLAEFDSNQLFLALGRQFGVHSVSRLYHDVFRVWLSGDTMRCRTVADIVFLLIKYLTEEEQDAMFDTFQQFPAAVVEWCVSLCVRHPHVRVRAARRWLRGARVRGTLRAHAARPHAHAALLLACLTDDPAGELLVSEDTVSDVLSAVCEALEPAPAGAAAASAAAAAAAAATAASAGAGTLESSAALGARLVTSLQEHTSPQYALLVLQLFRLNVLVPRGDSRLSVETWCEVRSSWQDGAAALSHNERTRFLQLAAEFLHDQLFQTMEKLDITKIENIVSVCPYLFNRCDEAAADVTDMVGFPQQVAPSGRELLADVTDMVGFPQQVAPSGRELLADVTDMIGFPQQVAPSGRELLADVTDMVGFPQQVAPSGRELLADVTDMIGFPQQVAPSGRELLADVTDMVGFPQQVAPSGRELLADVTDMVGFPQQVAPSGRELLADVTDMIGFPQQVAPSGRELLADVTDMVGFPQQVAPSGRELLADVTDMIGFPQQVAPSGRELLAVRARALRRELLVCHLNCLYDDDDDDDAIAAVVRHEADSDEKELTKTDLLLYVNKHLFRAIYLRTLLLHEVDSADDDEEPSEQKTWCNVLLNDENVRREFCNVLYTYVVINSLHEGYAFWPHYDIIVECKRKLECLLKDVISATSVPRRSDVTATLWELSVRHGYFWAYAYRWYTLHADLNHEKGILDGQKLDDIVSGNGYFHTLQASTKWGTESNSVSEYKILYLVMLRSWYIAHGARGEDDLLRDVTRCRDSCDLDVVVNAYYNHNHTMLYDMDISTCTWSSLVSNVAVLEFLTAMVTSRGWDASAHHWDFTTISLCSLLASVRKSVAAWGSTEVCTLARAALRLWGAVARFVRGLARECERRAPSAHVAALGGEWRDVFLPDTSYSLLHIIMHVLDSCGEGEMTSPQVEVIGELIECTQLLNWDALADAHKHDALSLVRLARCAADALQTPAHHACLQLAYRLLLALSKPLVLDDAEKLSLWSEDSSEGDEEMPRPQFCLDLFHDAFTHLHDLVDAALSNVVLGERTCEVVAMSDTYSVALGWLLLADVLAQLCDLARGDLTHHYIQIYRERGYAEPLVTATLRLLPLGVFQFASDNTGTTPAPPAPADLFLSVRPFSVHEPARGTDISALACRALYRSVCGAGTSGARGWWGAAGARGARLLERVVVAYVAPPAARDQLLHLHQRAHEIEDAEVRIAWSSNEVTCVYNVEERLIELRVWLARAHPLAAPRLAAPHAQGPGADTHWVALYLSYQNGTLLNALKMWTRAVSAKVEASPQCYICYCRLHPNNGRLPRVLCYQCKNKFHTICLRKWFSTSNKSNCPLCRAAF